MQFVRKRMPGSIFRKFFIMISAAVLLSLAVSGIFLLFLYVDSWNKERLTSLSDDALSLTQSVGFLFEDEKGASGDRFDDEEVVIAVAGAISSLSLSKDEEVFIADRKGKILLCKDVLEMTDGGIDVDRQCALHLNRYFPADIVRGVRECTESVFSYEGYLEGFGDDNYFLTAAPVTVSGETVHYVYVLQEKGDAYLPYTTDFMRMLISAELLALLICFIAALIISYRMTKPIKKITEATKHYAGGDFSMRIAPTDASRELAELIESVNSMAADLAVLEESRSNFVANISHELKTPMTIIGGFIDGMLDGTISDDEREKYLLIVSDEVRRLSRLVVAMLNMSKIQAGKLTINVQNIDITDILVNILIGFENDIEEKQISVIGLDECEKLTIGADGALINQIFYNLIDNAVKFTPEKGSIFISVSSDKKNAVIVIRNTGKGISEDELGLIFDRFYKGDRSRGLKANSFGLGLYIVKSVVELHNGSVSVTSDPDAYTEFTVKLPL